MSSTREDREKRLHDIMSSTELVEATASSDEGTVYADVRFLCAEIRRMKQEHAEQLKTELAMDDLNMRIMSELKESRAEELRKAREEAYHDAIQTARTLGYINSVNTLDMFTRNPHKLTP